MPEADATFTLIVNFVVARTRFRDRWLKLGQRVSADMPGGQVNIYRSLTLCLTSSRRQVARHDSRPRTAKSTRLLR